MSCKSGSSSSVMNGAGGFSYLIPSVPRWVDLRNFRQRDSVGDRFFDDIPRESLDAWKSPELGYADLHVPQLPRPAPIRRPSTLEEVNASEKQLREERKRRTAAERYKRSFLPNFCVPPPSQRPRMNATTVSQFSSSQPAGQHLLGMNVTVIGAPASRIAAPAAVASPRQGASRLPVQRVTSAVTPKDPRRATPSKQQQTSDSKTAGSTSSGRGNSRGPGGFSPAVIQAPKNQLTKSGSRIPCTQSSPATRRISTVDSKVMQPQQPPKPQVRPQLVAHALNISIKAKATEVQRSNSTKKKLSFMAPTISSQAKQAPQHGKHSQTMFGGVNQAKTMAAKRMKK